MPFNTKNDYNLIYTEQQVLDHMINFDENDFDDNNKLDILCFLYNREANNIMFSNLRFTPAFEKIKDHINGNVTINRTLHEGVYPNVSITLTSLSFVLES